ncbi:Acg family FMN-binding oxidoreductase [Stakelama tenebrarum]|uniref:Tat pathway signal protein n=1 Tax=Stakelama tenebrarum TaxID=2711215 RepID=A0A6G6Y8X4_9SPHN|nr:nitroreductase family protein [Sphingosinithalassobacter tenebrarum]QIG81392.1 Tat pathway signal protein [Sphingosinithalassobacter tenebrarum]
MNRRTLLLGGAAAGVSVAGVAGISIAGMGSRSEYDDWARDLRRPLAPDAGPREAVRYAGLAANGHNTQPWRFVLEQDRLRILPDFDRRTPVVDPDDHHLFVSLGAAAENASLALRVMGLGGAPIADDAGAALEIDAGLAEESALLAAVPQRQSSRTLYDGSAIPAEQLRRLQQAAAVPGVRMVLLTDAARRATLRDMIVAGNDMQMADPAFMAELKQWLRFNPASAMRRGDGLFTACTGNPSMPGWIGGPVFDFAFDPGAESDRYAAQADSSAGFAVFFGEKADREHWMRVGHACQRFALAATAAGLAHAFVNQPVEVPALCADLAALAGESVRPDLVIRFGHGPRAPYSPRRPVSQLLA